MKPYQSATNLDALLEMLNDDWYNSVEGSYLNVPNWGPETEQINDQINSSCGEGDIVSWDTTDPNTAQHRYLRRDWAPARERGVEHEFSIVVGEEYYS